MLGAAQFRCVFFFGHADVGHAAADNTCGDVEETWLRDFVDVLDDNTDEALEWIGCVFDFEEDALAQLVDCLCIDTTAPVFKIAVVVVLWDAAGSAEADKAAFCGHVDERLINFVLWPESRLGDYNGLGEYSGFERGDVLFEDVEAIGHV